MITGKRNIIAVNGPWPADSYSDLKISRSDLQKKLDEDKVAIADTAYCGMTVLSLFDYWIKDLLWLSLLQCSMYFSYTMVYKWKIWTYKVSGQAQTLTSNPQFTFSFYFLVLV